MNKLYIVIFIMGIMTASINAANGLLADHIGLLESVLIIHGIGLIISTIYFVFLNKNRMPLLPVLKSKPYLFIGGFIGSFAVVSISFSVQNIGVFLVSTALVAGQFLFSFFIDANGWFGFDKVPITKKKLLSITLMIVGVGLISL